MKSKNYPGVWELKHRNTYSYRKDIAASNGMWDQEHKVWLFRYQIDYLNCYALCENKSPEEMLEILRVKQPEDWATFELPKHKPHFLSEYTHLI